MKTLKRIGVSIACGFLFTTTACCLIIKGKGEEVDAVWSHIVKIIKE